MDPRNIVKGGYEQLSVTADKLHLEFKSCQFSCSMRACCLLILQTLGAGNKLKWS